MYKHNFHPSILREYDIRGIINETLYEKDAFMIGYFFGLMCKEKNLNNESNIVISMDGRLSSPDLKKQTISGLSKSGCNVIDLGLNPTPILYFGSHNLNADGAIQITGSHNPKNYNGFKMMIKNEPFFGKDIQNLGIKAKSGSNIKMNGSVESSNFDEKYLEKILMPLANAKNLKDKKIIWDCGNGATGDIINKIVKLLPCENTVLYSEIDGNFPNHHPDPSNENNLVKLKQEVKRQNADFGFAFDGDGDRVGVVTNDGKIVFPDKILMILSKDILATKKGTIIFDVKCTDSLPKLIKENGGNPIMYPTGHFNIKNGIKEHNPLLAGEMSGHIFFNDKWYGFDDGIYSGARIIELILKNRKSISSLNKELPELFSTHELNIEVSDESKFEIVKKFIAQCSLDGDKILIDGLRINFKNGWGLLRASNTTPMLVLRFEGDTEENLIQIKNKFIKELARICPDIDINLN